MKTTLKFIKGLYRRIVLSIAFYPVLISFGFLILALTVISLETREFAKLIRDTVPAFYIQHTETARTLLSTVIGGILSLTVFSFSMVMVVLNQASSNYSPRLLPGLISDKKHQIILGFYTGTLLYCLLILTTLGSYNSSEDSVGFAVMLGAIFGIMCVSLFVYFIHNISVVIQIDHIINKITLRSDECVDEKLLKEEKTGAVHNEWKTIYSTQSGYYRNFDFGLLTDSLRRSQNQIEIIPFQDEHVWEGDPILKIQHELSPEELTQVELCINFVTDRHDGNSYMGGMIKLMEIAVKAMSPGINDPGTAINVISRITKLISKTLDIPAKTSFCGKKESIKIIENNITPKELMRMVVQPIRYYSRRDCSVTIELIKALKHLQRKTPLEEVKLVIQDELDIITKYNSKVSNKSLDTDLILSFIKK